MLWLKQNSIFYCALLFICLWNMVEECNSVINEIGHRMVGNSRQIKNEKKKSILVPPLEAPGPPPPWGCAPQFKNQCSRGMAHSSSKSYI